MKTRKQSSTKKVWSFATAKPQAKMLCILAAIIGIVIIGCQPEHTHQWGEWTVTKAPTITEEGEETRTCSTCGEKETRVIPKQIQREFTDLTLVRGKSITLIDETGGTTDLKTQGIWQKINEAFGEVDTQFTSKGRSKFDEIYTKGGHITIKVVISGDDFKLDGHEI